MAGSVCMTKLALRGMLSLLKSLVHPYGQLTSLLLQFKSSSRTAECTILGQYSGATHDPPTHFTIMTQSVYALPGDSSAIGRMSACIPY